MIYRLSAKVDNLREQKSKKYFFGDYRAHYQRITFIKVYAYILLTCWVNKVPYFCTL